MTPAEQDKSLEAQILAKGLTAPRVLPHQIDDLVEALTYHTYVIPGTTVTVAAAIAPGGMVVALGKSGAASASNFDEVIGRNRAISKAKDAARGQLWELEGWRLKRNLLDLDDAGMLDTFLSPSLPKHFGEAWPAILVAPALGAQLTRNQVANCGQRQGDRLLCGCSEGQCLRSSSVDLHRCNDGKVVQHPPRNP